MHHRIMATDALGLMTRQRNGEMHGQNGVGVHEQLIAMLAVAARHRPRELLRGTVLCTQEAWALADGLLVDLRSRRHHACRIPLDAQRCIACRKLTRLHIRQVAIASVGIAPFLQLSVEEAGQRRLAVRVLLHLACVEFHRAQTVFIEVVGILFLDGEGGIAVSLPAAAEIQLVVDAADAPLATEGQSHRIVFAIAGIGELQLPDQRCEEGARRSESVDAQRIVRAVAIGPLAVVDESGRECLQLEIAHAV